MFLFQTITNKIESIVFCIRSQNNFSRFLQIGLYDVRKHDISNITTTLNVKFDEASKKPERNKY